MSCTARASLRAALTMVEETGSACGVHLAGTITRTYEIPDDRGDRLGQYVGCENHEPQEAPAEEIPVQQQREADADGQLDDQGQAGDDQIVQDRLLEDGAGQRLLVVLDADGNR